MTGLRSSVFSSTRRPARRFGARQPLALVAVLVAVLLMATLLAQWIHASRAFSATNVPALAEAPPGSAGQQGVETLVVLTAPDPDDGSDSVLTMAVAQSHPARTLPAVLVLPLALEVTAPGHGTLPLGEVLGRGGPDLLVRTIQSYTGLDLEHIVQVQTSGLADMADHLGGVDLCAIRSSRDCRSAGSGVVTELLEGSEGADDLAQFRVRLAVATAVMDKASDRLNVARRPLGLARAVTSAGRSLLTDVNLGGLAALRWADRVGGTEVTSLDLAVVPFFTDPASGRIDVFPEEAESVFQALREGTDLPESARGVPSDLVPGEIAVVVLNGSGIDGLAAGIADELGVAGFEIVEVDNATSFDITTTTIDFSPGARQLAELVASRLGGGGIELREAAAELFRGGRPIDVIVTIGSDRAPTSGDDA